MGAQGKMLNRHSWRGQCACCNGPRAKGQLKAEEKREVRAMAFEALDELSGAAGLRAAFAEEDGSRCPRSVVRNTTDRVSESPTLP